MAAEKGEAFLIGEHFQNNATSIVYGLPDAFQTIAGNDLLLQAPSAQLQQFFGDGQAINNMINVMVSIAIIDKGLDFIIKKPNPLTFFGGTIIKYGIKAGLAYYLVSEFGEAAEPLFEELQEVMEKIHDLGDPNQGDLCSLALEHQAISEQLAQALLDFVKEAGIGRLRGVKKTLNIKDKNKGCKNPEEPDTKKQHQICYGKKVTDLLSTAQINKIEKELGGIGQSEFCKSK